MRCSLPRFCCLAVLYAGLRSGCAFAQAGRSQGSISGQVTDASGAAIARATVTLSTPEHGLSRSALSGADGAFRFLDLPSGTYQLAAAAQGFAPNHVSGLVVAVGRNSSVTLRLVPAASAERVEVRAQQSSLDPAEPSQTANIDRDRIEELPIPQRNYLSFTLLAPAVAPANPAFAQQSQYAGASGFSFGGLRPNSNAIYLDGAEDTDEYSGASRTELSPEAISDFQIVNHGFAPESGGAAGGSVDVETRSGANLAHGDAFLFVQNGALNGTPPLELVPRKPDENRLRAGLSRGGAVRRKALFYYAAGEYELARGEDANDLSPATISAANRALRRGGPLRGFLLTPGFIPTTDEETELSGRLDRAWSARHMMMARYALTNNRAVNDAFHTDDLADRSARGSAFTDDNSVTGAWTWTLSPGRVNRLALEAAERKVAMRTISSRSPGVWLPGIAQFGTPISGNGRRHETHLDAGDILLAQRGRHLLGAGAELERIALRAAMLDGFRGLYVFPSLDALAAGTPSFFTQAWGNPNTNFAELGGSVYAQDHWTPRRSLVLDYGLRYDFHRLPSSLSPDGDGLSPRIGFAWSAGDKWVARGGFGLFYDRYLLSSANRVLEFHGARAATQVAEGPQAAALYGSATGPAAPVCSISPSVWRAQPGLANPYSEVASLGVERALPAQWTAKAEYQFVHGLKLGRTVNVNLPPPVLAAGGTSPVQDQGRFVFPSTRFNPAYDAVNQWQTQADSNYNGVTVTINRQFTEEFELMAGYTFSKTFDDASYDAEQPQNPYDLPAERALSLQDQRHRFVLSGLWVLGPDPDDPQPSDGAASNPILRALYGLEFAPILSANSGFRDNPLTGQDSNAEHIYPFAARPVGLRRNSLATAPNVNLDLRVLRMIPFWRGHLDIVAESFNLLNHPNPQLLNTAYGTGSTPQAGFGRPIQDGEPRRLQFSLDFEY